MDKSDKSHKQLNTCVRSSDGRQHLTFNQRVPGSSPGGRTNADLAQLVEQLTCNQQVAGSIPTVGTIREMKAASGQL